MITMPATIEVSPFELRGHGWLYQTQKKIPVLMEEFVTWINSSKHLHPGELAIEAHYQLITIHPFVDGSGRTARLLMNMILLMQGYPMAILRKRDRLRYINGLEKAQLGGSQDDYQNLMYDCVDRSLNIYINAATGSEPPLQKGSSLLKIGQLAKEVGETVPTIRHWTKLGLLEVAEITSSQYQMYSPECIERIQKIKNLKAQRYTLNEIKNIIEKDGNTP